MAAEYYAPLVTVTATVTMTPGTEAGSVEITVQVCSDGIDALVRQIDASREIMAQAAHVLQDATVRALGLAPGGPSTFAPPHSSRAGRA